MADRAGLARASSRSTRGRRRAPSCRLREGRRAALWALAAALAWWEGSGGADGADGEAATKVLTERNTPETPSKFTCAVLDASLCAWHDAAYVSAALANGVRNASAHQAASMDGGATRFAEAWVNDQDFSEGAPRMAGGFTGLLCVENGARCATAASVAGPATQLQTWDEHFATNLRWRDNEPKVQPLSILADELGTALPTAVAAAIADAAKAAKSAAHGVWTNVPLWSCGKAFDDIVLSASVASFSRATKLRACLTTRPVAGSSQSTRVLDKTIVLFAFVHLRYLPPKAIPPNFRLPGTAPNDPANAATRDDGLLCASYFFDSEESEILPCSSDESTACAQTNARVLAARAKRALAECEANNECTYKVLQAISWDEEYSIGKQISADFFYAFVTTDTGEILAHGGNPTIVGQNLGTDFGEYGEGAWKAIQNAGAQHEGFGGVATYKWPTTSCQNTENDGNCEPVAKVSNVFAWHAIQHKLFVGVGYNHFRRQSSTQSDQVDICPDGYASPCAARLCDHLTAHVISALSIYNPETVFAQINAGSPEYSEGEFYVFALDGDSALFMAHGRLGSNATSNTIISVAGDIGLTSEQLESGEALFNQMLALGRAGGGYARYNWTHPLHGVKPKLSFIREIKISVNNTQKEVIVGVGYSIAPLPIEHNQSASCDLQRISACSRRLLLGAVGYAQASAIDALSILDSTGDNAAFYGLLEAMANATAITKLIPGLQESGSSEFDDVRLSLIHFSGVVLASSERARNGNRTWGVQYPDTPLRQVLIAESRAVDADLLLETWVDTSLSGGGFVQDALIRRYSDRNLTDRGRRYAYVSSEICHLELVRGDSNCAMVVAEQLDLGCGEGSILVGNSCVECPAGTHHASPGDAMCTPCPAGSFTALPGRTECTLCSELPDAQFRYQSRTNAESCDLCPANTVRLLTDPGRSIDECHCVSGYYQPERAPFGRECMICPEGGACLGATNGTNRDPYPLPGYWGMKDHPHMFIECGLGDKNCIGGESFLCGEGYYGNVCSECENGYYRVYDTGYPRGPAGEGACRKCAPGAEQWAITIAVSFLIFALWFGLNEVPFEALTVMLEFMQISDIIGKFNLDFPPSVALFWQILSHSVNFDVDIVVYWQCHFPSWRLQAAMLLLFSIAWGKTFLVALVYYAKALAFYLVKNRYLERFPPFLEADQRYIDDGPDRLIQSLLQMHWVMYLAITERVYDAYIYEKLPDGTGYLPEAPWVLEDSVGFRGVISLAVCGTVVYAIALPVFVAWVLIRGKQNNLLSTRRYLTRYGFLYRKYDPKHYYWELVILARRITICLTLKFASHDKMLQAAIGIILCGVFMSATSYALPYRVSYIDKFDFFLSIICMVYVIVGLVDTYSTSEVVRMAFEILIMALFAVSILLLILLLHVEHDEYRARLRSIELSSARFAKVLTEECVPDEGESMEEARQRVRRVLLASRLAFRLLDRACNGQVSVDEFQEQFPKLYVDQADRHAITREQAVGIVRIMHSFIDLDDASSFVETDFLVHIGRELMSRNVSRVGFGTGVRSELRRMGLDEIGITDQFVTDAVDALGRYVESHPNSKELFAETLHDFETSQFSIEQNLKLLGDSVFREILETLDSHGMVGFFEDITKEEAMEVIRLEKLLDDVLHDSSLTSDFSHSARSSAVRSIMRAAPCLLEYLANPAMCSKEDRDAIARMVDFASETHRRNNSLNNSFASMVSVLDQASIFAWLMHASERDRSSLYWLIDRVRTSRESTAQRVTFSLRRSLTRARSWVLVAGDVLKGKETPGRRFVAHRWQSAKNRVKEMLEKSSSSKARSAALVGRSTGRFSARSLIFLRELQPLRKARNDKVSPVTENKEPGSAWA